MMLSRSRSMAPGDHGRLLAVASRWDPASSRRWHASRRRNGTPRATPAWCVCLMSPCLCAVLGGERARSRLAPPHAWRQVVGATDTDALARTRAAAPDIWILAPGVGFQGGDLVGTVRCALRKDGLGLLVPVSRGISRDADPKAAAHRLRDELNAARAEAMAGPAVGLPGPSRLAPYQAEFCNLALVCAVPSPFLAPSPAT